MKKGVSSTVAVVMLISISVIAAVGLYFWVGGLASKGQTPGAARTIQAIVHQCGEVNTDVIITQTSPEGASPIQLPNQIAIAGGNGDEVLNTTSCAGTIGSGESLDCKIFYYGQGDGQLVIYGAEGSNVASTIVNC